MAASVSLPDGLTATLLRNITYLTGTYLYPVGAEFEADGLVALNDPPIATLSQPPITTLYTKDGKEIKGYLDQAGEKMASLTLEDGRRLKTHFSMLLTAAYARHRFLVDKEMPITMRFKYHDGLNWSITSRVIGITANTYTIQQQLTLTNNLPYDLNDVKDVLISFQNYEDRYPSYSKLTSSSVMLAGSPQAERSRTETVSEEVATPISLGPLKSLPRHNVKTFTPFAPVIVDVKEVYIDISLDSEQPTTNLILQARGQLYPSTVYFLDEKSLAPISSFGVGLQKASSTFEAELGRSYEVTVQSVEISGSRYKVTITNVSDREQKLRFKGWRLKGRKDGGKLKPKETLVFEGTLPETTRAWSS